MYRAPFAPDGPAAIDERTAAALLDVALETGGDWADMFFEYDVAASWTYEDAILKSAGRSVTMGVGVRVMHGECTGYAYVEDFAPQSIRNAARAAARIARSAARGESVRLEAVSVADRYPVEVASVDVEGAVKRELLRRADAAARAADPSIRRVEVSLAEQYREILVASSDGRFARDRQPMLRFGIRVIAERGGLRQAGSSGGGGRIGLEYFERCSPEVHAREAVRHALAMIDARPAPAGELPVVLAPGDSGILLHEAVGHGLEADFNRKKVSRYSDRLGERVASPLCTVVDDATVGFGRGSIGVDDEGRVPGRTVLIEDGVLRGYLHDRLSASIFGLQPTGNGRRQSFACPPMPRMTNTFLLAGRDDPQDIVRSVARGIYARKFGGGQVDIGNGDFVFSLTEAYLIEEGRITAPLRGVNLIGNGPETMSRVVMLGHDFAISDGIWTCGKDGQSVPVGVGCPTVKIERMTVGGTERGP